MQPPHGRAPVYLHDLIHELASSPVAHPKPKGEKSEAMTPVPVEISILATDKDGRSVHVLLPCSEWALHPAAPGQPARLTLCAVVEAPYQITDTTAPPPAEETQSAPPDNPTDKGPHGIDELNKYPEDFFKPNPDAVNSALAEIAKKGTNPDGNKAEG